MTKAKNIPMNGFVSRETQQHSRLCKIQVQLKEDRHQTLFSTNPAEIIQENKYKYAKITEKGIDPFRNTTCPFCLSYVRLRLFLISNKKGYDRGLGKCPECGQKMKLKTLVMMETCEPEEYAKFVFEYRRSGFWQKIKFASWKDRLKIMKWTKRFWDEYKRLRGDSPDPEGEKELEEKWKSYEEANQ